VITSAPTLDIQLLPDTAMVTPESERALPIVRRVVDLDGALRKHGKRIAALTHELVAPDRTLEARRHRDTQRKSDYTVLTTPGLWLGNGGRPLSDELESRPAAEFRADARA